jgi:hypothetical protein
MLDVAHEIVWRRKITDALRQCHRGTAAGRGTNAGGLAWRHRCCTEAAGKRAVWDPNLAAILLARP